MITSDKKLKQQIIEAFPHLSPSLLEQEIYQHRIEELSNEVNMRDGYKLIGFFDSFCKLHEINYFAFADTLAAAVTYHDFIPGIATIEIGMLRDEYMKLERAHNALLESADYSDSINLKANPSGFILQPFLEGQPNVRRRIPLVVLCEPEIVSIEGTTIYSDIHMPLTGNATIRISIFDAIPNDYDLSRAFFYKLKVLNTAFDKTKGRARAALSKQIWNLADSYNNSPHTNAGRLFPTRSKSAPLKDLIQTKRVEFGPVEIAIPSNTRAWVYENSLSQTAQVKILQQDALAITKEIDRICRKHDIGYFICGGSMLGLVRHGGFIPWDDDMDVAMLREDYEKFLNIAADELGEDYFLQTRQTDPNIPYLFSKVRLKDSEYITTYNELRDFNKGICVDVFPFDKVPYEYGILLEHKAKVDALAREHNKTVNRQVPEGLPHEDASSLREALEKGVMTARHRVYWNKSLQDTQAAYDKMVRKFNHDKKLHYVASFVPTFTMIHLDDLLPYQDVQFEDCVLSAPAKPEIFLQMQYGDYMSMPMPHQQRGHGLLRWRDKNHSSEEFE